MHGVLSDKVEKVVVSYRVFDSPRCTMYGVFGGAANREGIVKAQAFRENSMAGYMIARRQRRKRPI